MTDAGTQRITAAVAQAASVPDTLDHLVHRSTADPGAPLAPDVVAALADLQRKDPGPSRSCARNSRRSACG